MTRLQEEAFILQKLLSFTKTIVVVSPFDPNVTKERSVKSGIKSSRNK